MGTFFKAYLHDFAYSQLLVHLCECVCVCDFREYKSYLGENKKVTPFIEFDTNLPPNDAVAKVVLGDLYLLFQCKHFVNISEGWKLAQTFAICDFYRF